jgi:hypothetical protein
MSFTYVAIGGAATMGLGSMMGAGAASGAAKSQQAEAEARLAEARARANQALDSYNQYAPSQQANINKAIASQQQNITRQQQLVDSIDPALLEAGKQMTSLLQGQSAPVLKNFQDQRNLQKQQMLDGLRQQIGPGAETSSMGQNMLLKFDQETANMQNGIQQQYLDKVSNLAIGGGQTLTDVMSKATGTLADLSTSLGQIGLNKANIINGGTQNMASYAKATVDSAGAKFAGDAAMARGVSQLGQAGLTAGVAGMAKLASVPGEASTLAQLGQGAAVAGSAASDYQMLEGRQYAGTNQPAPQNRPAVAGGGNGNTLGSLNPTWGVPQSLNPNASVPGYNGGQDLMNSLGGFSPYGGGSKAVGGYNQ